MNDVRNQGRAEQGGEDFRTGYAAIVGRPNVGKSTLLNALIGERVSIVSAKPHTTRHRILGVLNRPSRQVIFVDTPGLQRASRGRRGHALRRLMARTIHQAIADADIILMMVDARQVTVEDRQLAERLTERADDTVLVLNKIDRIQPRSALLPLLDGLSKDFMFSSYIPVSSTKGTNLDRLVEVISERLPPGPALFPPDAVTDRGERFRIAEFIREKLLSALHQEVPYGLTVEVEYFGRSEEQWLVHAIVWVERASHKSIVIGRGGRVLKAAGQAARRDLVKLLDGRVHLELWVKVREHWADSERELRSLGFDT